MTEIRLGSVTGSHGVKGWVKVFSFTDPIDKILEYSPWIIRKGDRELHIEVEDGRLNGKKLIAQLGGVADRNEADLLAGAEIFVPRERLPSPEEGEYYWYQLEGLTVVNTNGEVLGRIDHLIETGANDVLVVRPSPESVDDNERLVPYVDDEIVQQVDLEAGQVVVAWEADY